jgi:uncharacterized protein (TIGR03435 family)
MRSFRRSPRTIDAVSATVFLATCIAIAQIPKQFDVAAITPNTEGTLAWSIRTPPGGRFTARNVTLRTLILEGFALKDFQLEGLPGWVDRERYDIVAKAETPGTISPDELRPLIRSLLISRFKMEFHAEKKERPTYSLVVAKNGAKLHPNTGTHAHSTDWGKDHINANDVTLVEFAAVLEGQLDKVVLDNTGIPGTFDFKMTWTPEQATDLTGPSIFTAIQEQFGLRLVSTKGLAEVTVIDHIEPPTEN